MQHSYTEDSHFRIDEIELHSLHEWIIDILVIDKEGHN